MSQDFSDPIFDKVDPGSLLSYPCSPEISDRGFRGIKINAPDEIYFRPGQLDPLSGAFAKVIVCGTYCFQYDTLGLNGRFLESIVLVAVDAKSYETFTGNMQAIINPVEMPDQLEGSGLTHEDLKEDIITEYFNPNLAEVLPLTPKEGEYFVYATLGPYKSNIVTIRLRDRTRR